MRGRFTTEELRDPSETHQKYERTVAHKHRRNNIIIDLKESIIDFQGDLFLFQPISHVIFHYQLFFFDFDWFLKITLFCCHTGAKVRFFFISLRLLVLDLNPNFQSCNTLQTLLP